MAAPTRSRVGLFPPLKADQQAYVVPGENALDLAELASVERDLAWAASACRLVYTRVGSPSTDMLRRACIDAALMRYRRCFNTGRRTSLADADLALSPDELALHDLVLFLADKSIAHCVDGDEQSLPYLLVQTHPTDSTFKARLQTCTTTTSHYNVVDAKAFEALCDKVIAVVRAKAEDLANKITSELTSHPTSIIKELAPVDTVIMDGDEVMARWRIEAAKAGEKRRKALRKPRKARS